MNTSQMIAALREKYAPPAYAFFEEVANGTGTMARRSADAIVMSLWPSRGLELQGFEVKQDRRDWTRELENPEKAEVIASRCDRWWLVIGDEKIIHDGELPPTWGLLVARGNKLVQKVEAPKLDAQPLTRAFLAAILRRAHESIAQMIPKKDIQAEIDRVSKEAQERWRIHYENVVDPESLQLRAAIEKFEAASGIKIADNWNAGPMGEAVRMLLAANIPTHLARLEGIRKQIDTISERIGESLKEARNREQASGR